MSWERGAWEKKVSQGAPYIKNNNYGRDNVRNHISGTSSSYFRSNTLSDNKKYLNKLNYIKDELLDVYVETNEDIDFLSFEEEGFIPIKEEFSKLKKFLDSTQNLPFKISNSKNDDENILFTTLSSSELNNCLNNIKLSNAYLTFGFLEFQGFKSPLYFIPIILNKNIIYRDYTREIKFNYFLKTEADIFRTFHGDMFEYLNYLNDIKGYKISNKSFIGNFNFKNLLIHNDLTLKKSPKNNKKLASFFNNDYTFSTQEIENLKSLSDLKYCKEYKMHGVEKIIINLLSKGKTILYVSSTYSKRRIKESLVNIRLNRLILDFVNEWERYSFFKKITMDPYQIDNLSNILERKNFNKKMLNILSKRYSKINLKPYEIQQKRNEYSRYNYEINILNISNSTLNEIKKYNREITGILNDSNLIELLTNYSYDFSMYKKDYRKFIEVLNSIKNNLSNFESLNQKLNEEYGFVFFENLNNQQDLENDYNQLIELIETYHEYNGLKKNKIKYFFQKINRAINKKNSTLIEYESKISSLENIEEKYFESNDFIKEMDENKFEELINELNNLNLLFLSLSKNIIEIREFYTKYTCFELSNHSFNSNLPFTSLKNYLKTFEKNLNDLSKLTKCSSAVKSFISEILTQKKDMDNIIEIFNYNVYNSILNNFYKVYPFIEGENLNYRVYKDNLDKLDNQIKKNKFYQNLNELWGNESKLNKNEEFIKQKELFNQKLTNQTLRSVKDTLSEFKMYIMVNKPMFIMDINQVYEYMSNKYKYSFDYVIVDDNFEFEISKLSLFLKSKNKLIDLRSK